MKKILLFAAATFMLVACSKNDPVDKNIPVESVSVPKTLALVVGGSETLTATVLPSTATDPTVSWSSSAPQTVSVDEEGRVEALAVTDTPVTITVTTVDGGKTAECAVTVTAVPPTLLVTSFEGMLSEPESEFRMAEPTESYENDEIEFTDIDGAVSFHHNYWSWTGSDYTFNGFTYTNRTDNTSPGNYENTSAITGKGKNGTTYLAVYSSAMFGLPYFTIVDPAKYALKGAWVTNSTLAYYDMLGEGMNDAYTTGGWYKITATGYDVAGEQIGTAELLLADYKSAGDKPISEWVWFDMTAIADAVKVEFALSCTNNNDYGMATAEYFCMDAVTLVEK